MPRYGFNVQWMLPGDDAPLPPTDLRLLDAVAGWGFDLVRIPTDYRAWTRPDPTGERLLVPDERALTVLDGHLAACAERGLHVSLNLHRAPGYCITGWEREPFDLWSDAAPQQAFVDLWTGLAARYRDVPAERLDFDLVNEPPALGLRGFTRERHASVIRRTVAAVRAVDAVRPLTIDGLDGGNLALPELADLAAQGVAHSTRGYQPYPVSHWGATWWQGWRDGDAPRWPGCVYEGRAWDVEDLRAFYAPWLAVEAGGVDVAVGEFGCYERTPQADALRWFTDLLGLFAEHAWGYALWEFEGPFGVVGHHRPGARFEQRDGYLVDAALLDLLIGHRR